MNENRDLHTKSWTVTDFTVLHNKDELLEAASLINKGELVAFPTETVYGLGANALSTEAVDKIFKAKGRPSDNPLIVHIASPDQLPLVVSEVSTLAEKCMNAFWPGPITFVLPAKASVPQNVTAGLQTVGVRMPDHAVARTLIEMAGVPVAAPSANLSGRPSPTTARHVWDDLKGRISGIVDGGDSGYGVESTVVDMTGDIPVILRPGGITAEQIKQVAGDVKWDPSLENIDEVPMSPGMKYTHYAPKGSLILIEGSVDNLFISKVNDLISKSRDAGERVGVITTNEHKDDYAADVVLNCGSRSDLRTVASRLYDVLREFDEQKATVIFSETFPEDGIGVAIMNRLRKAAGSKSIKI